MKAASPSFRQSQWDRLLETASLSDTILTSQCLEPFVLLWVTTFLLQDWVLVMQEIQTKKGHGMKGEE